MPEDYGDLVVDEIHTEEMTTHRRRVSARTTLLSSEHPLRVTTAAILNPLTVPPEYRVLTKELETQAARLNERASSIFARFQEAKRVYDEETARVQTLMEEHVKCGNNLAELLLKHQEDRAPSALDFLLEDD